MYPLNKKKLYSDGFDIYKYNTSKLSGFKIFIQKNEWKINPSIRFFIISMTVFSIIDKKGVL